MVKYSFFCIAIENSVILCPHTHRHIQAPLKPVYSQQRIFYGEHLICFHSTKASPILPHSHTHTLSHIHILVKCPLFFNLSLSLLLSLSRLVLKFLIHRILARKKLIQLNLEFERKKNRNSIDPEERNIPIKRWKIMYKCFETNKNSNVFFCLNVCHGMFVVNRSTTGPKTNNQIT